MTNKEFMCTLDTNSFETAMHTLYYKSHLWVEGDDERLNTYYARKKEDGHKRNIELNPGEYIPDFL